MNAEQYLELIKDKKRDRAENARFNTMNFPNKIIGARLTGTTEFRDIVGGGAGDYSKEVYEFDLDSAALPELQRVNFPPQDIAYETGVTEDVFYLYHFPYKPWAVNGGFAGDNGLYTTEHEIGTGSIKFYSRDELEDPFTLYDTWPLKFLGQFTFDFYGGGHPVSGGRGADSIEKRMTGGAALNVTGLYDDPEFPFTLYEFTIDGVVASGDHPYPWDDPWPDHTDIFTDSFDDVLADIFSGDTTGSSCSLSFEWLY